MPKEEKVEGDGKKRRRKKRWNGGIEEKKKNGEERCEINLLCLAYTAADMFRQKPGPGEAAWV